MFFVCFIIDRFCKYRLVKFFEIMLVLDVVEFIIIEVEWVFFVIR